MSRVVALSLLLGLTLPAFIPGPCRGAADDACTGFVVYRGKEISHGGSYYFSIPVDVLASEVKRAGADSIQFLSRMSFRASRDSCAATFTGLPDSGTVDVGEIPSGDATEAQAAAASARAAASRLVRRCIFTQAVPRPRARDAAPAAAAGSLRTARDEASEALPGIPGLGHARRGATEVFYNEWTVDGADGSTYGVNPSASWGERYDLTVTMPVHVSSPDEEDMLFAVGFDGAFRYPFAGSWKALSAGVHAYGMGFYGDESTSTYGYGPFLSLTRSLAKWIVSAGALLEFTEPDEGDSVTELVPALNVGYVVSERVAVNAYAIHFMNFDSAVEDDAYTDIGGDLRCAVGTWSLSGGLKTTTGLEDFESTEYHLGSSWAF